MPKQVPKQECKNIPKQVPKQECRNVPRQECKNVPKQVPKQECRNVPRQVMPQNYLKKCLFKLIETNQFMSRIGVKFFLSTFIIYSILSRPGLQQGPQARVHPGAQTRMPKSPQTGEVAICIKKHVFHVLLLYFSSDILKRIFYFVFPGLPEYSQTGMQASSKTGKISNTFTLRTISNKLVF